MLVVPLAAGDAWARAGGGQGYHGGGQSPGGGFHGGEGGDGGMDIGPFVYFFIQFAIHYPYIALPLAALAIYLFMKASQQGGDVYRSSVIRRAGNQQAQELRDEALQSLLAGDPAFDEAAFCARAGQAFVKLQQAWSAQLLTPIRPFVSDGIFERFSLQIAEQRDFNYRNQVDRVDVHEVQLVQVVCDTTFDLLTVAIRAQADDYRVALDTGQRLRDGGESDEFVEYWSFLRRHGVTSADRPGLLEGQCPNCGAEIELNESARCASCDSLVRSGNFDWVLVEITQSSEWRAGDAAEPAGARDYCRQHDPGFSVEHLEDRTSVIFWRRAMADRLGDVRPLLKMARAEFCDSYPRHWGLDKAVRRYRGDAAVGSVETLGILPGQPFDRALVEVRWAGRMFAASAGQQPQPAGDFALLRSLYVLERKAGVTSDVSKSLTSAHCPNCGGPQSDLADAACGFCGAVLNDGSHDWVLAELLPIPSPEAGALVERLDSVDRLDSHDAADAEPNEAAGAIEQTPAAASAAAPVPRSGELLAWAVEMALADQMLSEGERRALERAASRRGVPPERLQVMIEAAQNGQLVVPQPQSNDEGRQWLAAMADMALADGRIEPAEKALLTQAAGQLGWSRADIEQLIAARKAQLYQHARGQLKNARGRTTDTSDKPGPGSAPAARPDGE